MRQVAMSRVRPASGCMRVNGLGANLNCSCHRHTACRSCSTSSTALAVERSRSVAGAGGADACGQLHIRRVVPQALPYRENDFARPSTPFSKGVDPGRISHEVHALISRRQSSELGFRLSEPLFSAALHVPIRPSVDSVPPAISVATCSN